LIVKVHKNFLSIRKSVLVKYQKVGLEAAIFERDRNRSLVEKTGTENVNGIKKVTDATNFFKW